MIASEVKRDGTVNEFAEGNSGETYTINIKEEIR